MLPHADGEGRQGDFGLWAFDLTQLDLVRLMPLLLHRRRERLACLIAAADTEHVQFSGAFDSPAKLLEMCERMGLEGIVSKRREGAYRPGPSRDWLKTKTASWRQANRDRFKLFTSQGQLKRSLAER